MQSVDFCFAQKHPSKDYYYPRSEKLEVNPLQKVKEVSVEISILFHERVIFLIL